MDPLRSETCWSTFKYFIIVIVSTYYMVCISLIIKWLISIDARCKHEDCWYNFNGTTSILIISFFFFGTIVSFPFLRTLLFISNFIRLSPISLLLVLGWSEASRCRSTEQTEKVRTHHPVVIGMRVTGHHTLVINTALWHGLLVSAGQMWFRVLIAWLTLNVAYTIYIHWPEIWYLWLPQVIYFVQHMTAHGASVQHAGIAWEAVCVCVCVDRNTCKTPVK